MSEDEDNVHPFPKPKRRKPYVPPGGWPSWRDSLLRDDKGRVIAELANVLIALRDDTRLDGAFAFDEMRQHSLIMAQLHHAPEAKQGYPRESEDDDVTRLQEWLQFLGLPRIGRETVGQALEAVAREHRFHPVKDRLGDTPWDETPRVTTWLQTYLGASVQEPEYVSEIGQMFLVAMIARIMKPGCKVDYMLVLEGEQGVLKSTVCRILAGEWFSDSLPPIGSKDAHQHLRGKWLIEVSELAAFTKAEIEPLKAFITRQTEQYRPPYARLDVAEPRQCVFVGTTNKAVYIKDDTGGRRFWPVKVGRIDIDALERDRDQLMAEALCLYRIGAPWWPTAKFEANWIKPEQELRREIDAWEPQIAQWLDGRMEPKVQVIEVARGALGFDNDSRLGTSDARRIMSAMSLAGWQKDPQRTSKGYWWVRVAV